MLPLPLLPLLLLPLLLLLLLPAAAAAAAAAPAAAAAAAAAAPAAAAAAPAAAAEPGSVLVSCKFKAIQSVLDMVLRDLDPEAHIYIGVKNAPPPEGALFRSSTRFPIGRKRVMISPLFRTDRWQRLSRHPI